MLNQIGALSLARTCVFLCFSALSACASIDTAPNQAIAKHFDQEQYSKYERQSPEHDSTAATGARPQGEYMPLGEIVPSPTGFLELCSRSPVDCMHGNGAEAASIQSEARIALAEKYQRAFAISNHQTVSTPQPELRLDLAYVGSGIIPSSIETSDKPDDATQLVNETVASWPLTHAPSPTPPLQPALDWPSRKSVPQLLNDSTSSEPQPGTISGLVPSDVPSRNFATMTKDANNNSPSNFVLTTIAPKSETEAPMSISVDDTSYGRILLTSQTFAKVRSLNAMVNNIIISDTDRDIYHVDDYWNAPGLKAGAHGDCEDYALQKRRVLIENGIPAAALSIAIVRTHHGEDHAVLILSSIQGDFVLDNMAYDVRLWQKTDYTWVSRQAPGDSLKWVSLRAANTGKSYYRSTTNAVAFSADPR